MKLVKGISLFFIFPLFMLGIGFYLGVETSHFFYPEAQEIQEPDRMRLEEDRRSLSSSQQTAGQDSAADFNNTSVDGLLQEDEPIYADTQPVTSASETLSVDTEYVLEEMDVLRHTSARTTWPLPDKYVGMNREQFLEAMEIYESVLPLAERQRGFVGLEVLSFSRERVVVRMNYKFVQPSASFYLAVYDNKVIVYLEDKTTVYIETEIMLDTLPEDLQQSIIDMMWVENEEKLYNILENYSS